MLKRGTTKKNPTDQRDDKSSHHQNEEPYRQSVADRRLLRAQYRAVKERIAERKLDSEGFDHAFGNMENLYSEVSQPREQIADAETLFGITASLLASVREVHHRKDPTAAELVSAIVRSFTSNSVPADQGIEPNVDWERLGQEASAIFSDAPGLTTMTGPMDSRQKLRKMRMRRPMDRPVETARPEELNESNDKETLTDKTMETMFIILKRLKSVYLEELVLNRHSFARTVENIFALSFLVKDGRAEIAIKDGRHIVVLDFVVAKPSVHLRRNDKNSVHKGVIWVCSYAPMHVQ